MATRLVEIYLKITLFSTFRASMIVHASNAIANFVTEAKRIGDGFATVRAGVPHFYLSSVYHLIFIDNSNLYTKSGSLKTGENTMKRESRMAK